MKIGDLIKSARKNKGLTQSELAEMLSISASAIGLYEQNRREPDIGTIVKIARILEVNLNYLLGFGDQKYEELSEPNKVLHDVAHIFYNETEKPADEGKLTEHEAAVLNAYRNQPEMQPAVDKLLGIYNEEYVQLYTAASSKDNRPDEIIKIPKEKWEKIKNTPDTDDTLM